MSKHWKKKKKKKLDRKIWQPKKIDVSFFMNLCILHGAALQDNAEVLNQIICTRDVNEYSNTRVSLDRAEYQVSNLHSNTR